MTKQNELERMGLPTIRWMKAIYDLAIGLTGAAIFTLGYFISIEYITPDEFTLVELILSVAASFLFTFTNSWTFVGYRFTFASEDFVTWQYFLWIMAVVVSTFVGISDGSTYFVMIAIPSGVVLILSIINEIRVSIMGDA